MSTALFFENEAKALSWNKQDTSFFEKLGIFYSRHAQVINKVALAILAAGVLSLAATLPSYFLFQKMTITILGMGSSLTLPAAISYIGLRILGIYFPSVHFKSPFRNAQIPEKYAGEMHGELYQLDGELFCLKIACGNDPVAAGKTRGYLIAEGLYNLLPSIRRFLWVSGLSDKDIHFLSSEKGRKSIRVMLAKLPEEIRIELENVMAGFKLWCKENRKSDLHFSLEELYLLHLLQETVHSFAKKLSRLDKDGNAFGCTCFVVNDPREGISFSRLLDWDGGGIFHLLTLVIATDYGATKTVELGFAPSIGTYTGMNNHGLALAMNITAIARHITLSDLGFLPSILLNKLLLKKTSLLEVNACIREQRLTPLAPYHLTIADQNHAETIHFRQNTHTKDRINTIFFENHFARLLKKEKPLFITNSFYLNSLSTSLPPEFLASIHKGDDYYGCYRISVGTSCARENRLQQVWEDSRKHARENHYEHSPAEVARKIVELPQVCNRRSIHTVFMQLKTLSFEIAFSGNYSGNFQRNTYYLNNFFK